MVLSLGTVKVRTLSADLEGSSNWAWTPVRVLGAISACTLCVCLVTIFAPPPLGVNSGAKGDACEGTPTEGSLCLCPRDTVCATAWHEVAFLAFARCSAYLDYPLYVLLFLSKCHNLRGALYRTHLREWLPLDDLHNLHIIAGTVVSFEVVWHSFWHMLRWGLGGDIRFLWARQTGVTGLLMLLLTPLITWPMMFRKLRRRVSFNVRKAMHFLSVVWCIGLCAHAPATRVGTVMGVALCLYLSDWLVGFFMTIHFCPTLKMTRLGESAVEVVFEHPPGFINRGGGYVYLCLPWLGKAEWHAFSLYAHPSLPNHSSVCIANVGDWTGALYRALSRPCSRPGYLYGPFPSPFSSSTDYTNLMAVASGIGITPTLGAVTQLSKTRRVNVLWMCRDPALIEYFVRSTTFDPDAWSLIFYTGKRPLVLNRKQFESNPRLLVIQGRPDIRKTIMEIMRASETDTLLSEELLQRADAMHRSVFDSSSKVKFQALLQRALATYSITELFDIGVALSKEIEQQQAWNGDAEEGRVRPFSGGSLSSALDGSWIPLHNGISFLGLQDLVSLLSTDLDSPPFDTADLQEIMNQIDSFGNSDGYLSLEELQEFTERVVRNNYRSSKPPTPVASPCPPSQSRSQTMTRQFARSQSLLHLRHEAIATADVESYKVQFSEWQMLYCGGAAPVVRELRKMQREYGISTKIESFDW